MLRRLYLPFFIVLEAAAGSSMQSETFLNSATAQCIIAVKRTSEALS